MAFKGTPIMIRDSDSEQDASTPAVLKARKQGLLGKSKVKVEEKQHQGSNQDLIPQNKEKPEQNSSRMKPWLRPHKKNLDRLTYPQYCPGGSEKRKHFPGPQGCPGSSLVVQEAVTTSASKDVAQKEHKNMKDVAQEEKNVEGAAPKKKRG